jgi:hypothetical protein
MAVNYGNVTIYTDIRSPIFYDSNNTGFYLDPASTSNFNVLLLNGQNTFNTTTPGLTSYGLTLMGGATDNANGLTWTWNNTNAQAGVYVQSSGAYGTRMYFATTDSFATGSKTAMTIDHVGNVSLNRGRFSNGSVWINNGSDFNSYNENIRLFNAPNGVSVISFGSSGISGVPQSSILGFSDRYEVRVGGNGNWQQRSYDGYTEINGSSRAPIFYDSNDTGRYIDPNGTSQTNSMRASEFRGNANVGGTGEATWHPAGAYIGSTMWQYGAMYKNYTDIWDVSNVYARGWFRNYGQQGIYNQDYGVHFYGTNSDGWALTGSGGNVQLQFRSNHGTGLRGYVYADTANNIGFLTSGGGWRLRCDDSGNAIATGDVTAYSDKRVKENIVTIEDPLDKVLSLRGVYYNRIDSDDKQRKIGVIAQETLEVLPEVVGQDTDGMYNVAYGNMVALLIEGMKEQQKQIEELKQLIKNK